MTPPHDNPKSDDQDRSSAPIARTGDGVDPAVVDQQPALLAAVEDGQDEGTAASGA